MDIPEEPVVTPHAHAGLAMWPKIIGAIVILLLVAGLLYTVAGARKTENQPPVQTTQNTTTSATQTVPSDNIYLTKTSTTKGKYLTDFAGMTLYVDNREQTGVLVCTGACLTTWKPYSSGATAQSIFPTNIGVIKRSDGTIQFSWKHMPLYYYVGDQNPGDMHGEGIGSGEWHIVQP